MMKLVKLKYYLDFVPLIVLFVYACLMIVSLSEQHLQPHWKNIIGLIVLPINMQLLLKKHKLGVVVLGCTIMLGVVGVMSFDAAISIHTISVGKTENLFIPIFYGQPVFLMLLLLHFLISGKNYLGVLTKSFWIDILKNTRDNKE